jgi:hypothetical protein
MHVVLLTDQVPSPTPQLARLSQVRKALATCRLQSPGLCSDTMHLCRQMSHVQSALACVQDAMRTGASVCFTVLDSATPAHDVASVEDHHAHFAAAIAPLEQLSLHVVQNGMCLSSVIFPGSASTNRHPTQCSTRFTTVLPAGRLLDEQLAQEWWQMLQGGCHLTTQALHGGLTPAGLSLQLPSQSGKDIMLACSVRAQIRPWSPALRCVAAGR